MSPEYSIEAQIACLKREIALRQNVYPKWIGNGRMKQDKADAEIGAMTAALHSLMAMGQFEKQRFKYETALMLISEGLPEAQSLAKAALTKEAVI